MFFSQIFINSIALIAAAINSRDIEHSTRTTFAWIKMWKRMFWLQLIVWDKSRAVLVKTQRTKTSVLKSAFLVCFFRKSLFVRCVVIRTHSKFKWISDRNAPTDDSFVDSSTLYAPIFSSWCVHELWEMCLKRRQLENIPKSGYGTSFFHS